MIMSWASIHKGTLRKKTDLKTDSFLLLFTDVLFGAFGRLPNFFTNRSFYNNTATHVGGGGGDVDNVNNEFIIKNCSNVVVALST
jgi:hypothetical protein